MSFNPRLSGNSLWYFFLLAAVKHKRFAAIHQDLPTFVLVGAGPAGVERRCVFGGSRLRESLSLSCFHECLIPYAHRQAYVRQWQSVKRHSKWHPPPRTP